MPTQIAKFSVSYTQKTCDLTYKDAVAQSQDPLLKERRVVLDEHRTAIDRLNFYAGEAAKLPVASYEWGKKALITEAFAHQMRRMETAKQTPTPEQRKEIKIGLRNLFGDVGFFLYAPQNTKRMPNEKEKRIAALDATISSMRFFSPMLTLASFMRKISPQQPVPRIP